MGGKEWEEEAREARKEGRQQEDVKKELEGIRGKATNEKKNDKRKGKIAKLIQRTNRKGKDR